jgi:hypothetical protein
LHTIPTKLVFDFSIFFDISDSIVTRMTKYGHKKAI